MMSPTMRPGDTPIEVRETWGTCQPKTTDRIVRVGRIDRRHRPVRYRRPRGVRAERRSVLPQLRGLVAILDPLGCVILRGLC